MPIPPGGGADYAGLLTVDPPSHLKPDERFTVVVRQVTNASRLVLQNGKRRRSPSRRTRRHRQEGRGRGSRRRRRTWHRAATSSTRWRRVLGAFQLTIPVKPHGCCCSARSATFRAPWIPKVIPHDSRWYPVLERYVDVIGDRVKAFGGDPLHVKPSPTGDPPESRRTKTATHEHHPPHRRHHPADGEERSGHTGKVAGLIFDRFGDFDGFVLQTAEAERRYFSREREIERSPSAPGASACGSPSSPSADEPNARRVDRESAGATGGDLKNIQVTHGTSLNDARSESVVRIDPANPMRIVGASRKCKDIAAYDFTVATVYSSNGGRTWQDSAAAATPGWSGLSDPALAWDDTGNVFLVGAAIRTRRRSTMSGPPPTNRPTAANLERADLVHASAGPTRSRGPPATAGAPPFTAGLHRLGGLRRAPVCTELDHGNTWIGAGTDPAGSVFGPAPSLLRWRSRGRRRLRRRTRPTQATNHDACVRGRRRQLHLVASPATGITRARGRRFRRGSRRAGRCSRRDLSGLHDAHGLRVRDDRGRGVGRLPGRRSRIYYARSTDGGTSWSTAGPDSRC